MRPLLQPIVWELAVRAPDFLQRLFPFGVAVEGPGFRASARLRRTRNPPSAESISSSISLSEGRAVLGFAGCG